MHKEDLEEFVLAGIRSDEDLKWFGRPRFDTICRNEFSSRLTKVFLTLAGGLGLLCAMSVVFSIFSTVIVIVFFVSLGALTLRLAWIYYLGRRLNYAITSSRLLYLLEAGRPIEYKSYSLSDIKRIERVDRLDGSSDIRLPEQNDILYGVDEPEVVEQLLGHRRL
ncbi:MAG: hypothetical protein V7776_08795 [Halopseudomonas aestusnigri]